AGRPRGSSGRPGRARRRSCPRRRWRRGSCRPLTANPAGLLLENWVVDGRVGWCGGRRRTVVVLTGVRGGPFALDELGQPPDLTVDRVETVFVQFAGVAVEPLARAGEAGAHALALL